MRGNLRVDELQGEGKCLLFIACGKRSLETFCRTQQLGMPRGRVRHTNAPLSIKVFGHSRLAPHLILKRAGGV